MKKIIILTIVSFISLGGYAKFVEYANAEKVARAHFYSSISTPTEVRADNIGLSCVSDPSVRNSKFKFYVFDLQQDGELGYVIVSSDDNIKPILAYSLTENFEGENIADAQKMFFDYFDECIEMVSTRSDLQNDEKIENEWRHYLEFDYSKKRNSVKSPELLHGIKWNQSFPYNIMCPEDKGANANNLNGRSPVGCVAVATLQVMKYYNWPPSGEGSYKHIHTSSHNMDNKGKDDKVPGYGTFEVNFGEQTYDWAKVPLKGSKFKNEELAKLCFHVGVALKMGWGTTASGAYPKDIVEALTKYFHFSKEMQLLERDSNMSDWDNILKAEIDAKRPMVYCGMNSANTSGHAWNCDGYDVKSDGSTFYHMNWGWGGSGDNYCTLENLVAASAPGGGEFNFVRDQLIVCKMLPKAFENEEFPKYCQENRVIIGMEGNFDDGSSYQNYKPNSNCEYLIKPECGSIIELSFEYFDIAIGDVVALYEGEGTELKYIDSFNKANPPKKGKFICENAMTIKFNTSPNGEAEGWSANYKVTNCAASAKPFTSASGTFTDGSGSDCKYPSSVSCRWFINPEKATKIDLDIKNLDLAKGDFLRIYKGKNATQESQVAELTSESPKNSTFQLGTDIEPIGELVVIFSSRFDSSGADGWEISYTSDGTSIEEESLSQNFSVLPNPGNKHSVINLEVEKTADYKISIVSMTGQTLGTKEMSLSQGQHKFIVEEFVNNKLENGVYIISLMSDNSLIKTLRFVAFD